MKLLHSFLFVFLFLLLSPGVFPQIIYPGKSPGKAVASHSGSILSLENSVVKIVFDVNKDQIHPEKFIGKENGNDRMKMQTF